MQQNELKECTGKSGRKGEGRGLGSSEACQALEHQLADISTPSETSDLHTQK